MKRGAKNEGGLYLIDVTLTPITWIIAPRVDKLVVQRYIQAGYFKDEEAKHLDRVFPRALVDGKPVPIILKKWIHAAMWRACELMGIDKELARRFVIIDDNDFPVDFIVIPGEPLRHRRVVFLGKESRSTEYFEFIDNTFKLKFKVVTDVDPATFCNILYGAGKIGIMAYTRHGYGKFTIEVKVSEYKGKISRELFNYLVSK